MKYKIIKTGSNGNCIIVEDKIILDIGVIYKTICRYLRGVKLIFVSHRHQDHLLPTCVRQIVREYPSMKFACNREDKDLIKILIKNGVQLKNIYALKENTDYDLGLFKMKLLPLVHDVLNSACIIEINGKKLIYITDTNSVEHIQAKNFDTILIEANYDNEEELDRLIQQDYNKGLAYSHYERVRKTHLSKEKAVKFLEENMGENSVCELIHRHQVEEEE